MNNKRTTKESEFDRGIGKKNTRGQVGKKQVLSWGRRKRVKDGQGCEIQGLTKAGAKVRQKSHEPIEKSCSRGGVGVTD